MSLPSDHQHALVIWEKKNCAYFEGSNKCCISHIWQQKIHTKAPAQPHFNKIQPQTYLVLSSWNSAAVWVIALQSLLLLSYKFESWLQNCGITAQFVSQYVLNADLSSCWSLCMCLCVCQDGLSAFAALWDLCYTGAPPLQPCCYDPAERGALCFVVCCNAVTITVLFMPALLVVSLQHTWVDKSRFTQQLKPVTPPLPQQMYFSLPCTVCL